VKLIRLFAVVAALMVFVALPSVTTATTPANTYNAYVACGYRVSKPPATSCPKRGRIGAFFQSADASVQYRTCVTFPNGQHQCTAKATADQGTFYVVKMTVGTKGRLKVRWKVDGVVVAKYSIKVT
jgi:hypothetical protein